MPEFTECAECNKKAPLYRDPRDPPLHVNKPCICAVCGLAFYEALLEALEERVEGIRGLITAFKELVDG